MENGDMVYVDAPTKQLAWLVFRQDCYQYWRVPVTKMGIVRNKPHNPGNCQVVVVEAVAA